MHCLAEVGAELEGRRPIRGGGSPALHSFSLSCVSPSLHLSISCPAHQSDAPTAAPALQTHTHTQKHIHAHIQIHSDTHTHTHNHMKTHKQKDKDQLLKPLLGMGSVCVCLN